jgi:cytidine deaminase
MKNVKYDNLTEIQKKLLNEAEKAMQTAYIPYSHFSVGAALLTSDGTMVTGSNIENASYSPSICAERSAIARANAMGFKMYKSIAVISKSENRDLDNICSPCGVCRQVLYEFSQISGVDLEVVMSNSNKDKIIIAKISELLPLAFGPNNLNVNIKPYKK